MNLSEELYQLDGCGDVGRAVEGMSERAKRLESIAIDHWMNEALRWGATYDCAVAWAEKRLEDINKISLNENKEEWRRIKLSADSNLTRMEQLIYGRLCSYGSISHEEISGLTGSFGISDSAKVHISNIRKKTGAEIISVRGFGYTINKP